MREIGLRGLLALWAGKIAIRLSRLLGRGGSNLPGRLVRRIDPTLLGKLARQCRGGRIMVTGTNGKTTTAAMIASILGEERVVHNRSGANLITGITAAFVSQAGLLGSVAADYAVVECDEATVPLAAVEVRPDVLVVNNFFRDQLDRYGELEYSVARVRAGIEELAGQATVVLNADDPLVAHLGSSSPQALYYGLESDYPGLEEPQHAADAKFCARCGSPYRYTALYYAHLGKYRCEQCGDERPSPHVFLRDLVRLGPYGSRLEIVVPSGEVLGVELRVPGLYNVYNALAAASVGVALGVPPAQIEEGLGGFSSSFGRMESITIDGVTAFMTLVKNPVGFNEVIRTVLEDDGDKPLVIAINDKFADGTDVSWLWDVDFERLARSEAEIPFVVCSGIRAEDMAVRLKYAGMPPDKLLIRKDLGQALEEALRRTASGTLYLMPTYTAMLEMRELLQRKGYVRHFWEA